MDFNRAYRLLADFLAEKGLRHALIGGVAMSAHGLVRATLDLDLAVDARAADAIVAFLEVQGYQTIYRSTGFSNHLHDDPELGRIDLLYLRGDTAEQIFSAATHRSALGGIDAPVASAEHIIAMKAAAMQNDPARRFGDLGDVRFLLGVPGIDREAIAQQFEKRGLGSLYRELEARL